MTIHIRRREFTTLLGFAAGWTLVAHAQMSKLVRVGIVSNNPPTAPTWVAFFQRMRELGHIEGQTLAVEFLHVARPDRYFEGMKELVRRKVDMLIAPGNETALKSALAATNTLPIVVIAIDYDPFGLGYVSSLARPAGNITGVFFLQIELSMKRLQILKEAFPELKAATVLWDQTGAGQWHAMQNAAATLGVQLVGVELTGQPYDYEQAMSQAVSRNPLLVVMSGFFFRDRDRLASFALQRRLVSFFGTREFVDAGGLMSYGPSIVGLFRRAAEYCGPDRAWRKGG